MTDSYQPPAPRPETCAAIPAGRRRARGGADTIPAPPSRETLVAAETALTRALQLRRCHVPEGTPPVEWSDEAQTAGWCLSLLDRLPHGAARDRLLLMLDRMGQIQPGALRTRPGSAP